MAYRVVQWATGGVGRAAIEGVLAHPDLELAGCWVHSASKDGVDVGTLLGGEPIGVAATSDVDAALAIDADCAVYAPLMADPGVVTRILESGTNVVTPLGWFFPPDEERAAVRRGVQGGRCHAARHRHPSRRDHRALPADDLGHGRIDHQGPGRGVLRHPHVRRSRCHPRLDAVRGDARARPHEHHGRRPRGRASASRCGWWPPSSVSTSTRSCGRRRRSPSRRRPSTRPSGRSSRGSSPPSASAGKASSTARPVITAAVNWLMGDEHLDPPWRFGPEGERFEVEITGDPGAFVTFKGLHPESIEAGLARNPGIVATAMHCVSAVPYVCEAPAGPAHLPRHAAGRRTRAPTRAAPEPAMILDRFRVDDRVAIVTGAGLGIGRGIAIGLAEAGAHVVLAARTEADLDEVAEQVPGPRPARPRRADRRHRRARARRLVDATMAEHRPARHPRQQRRRRHAPTVHGHQRGLPRAGLPLQRHRRVQPHASWRRGRWSTPSVRAPSSTSRRARRA